MNDTNTKIPVGISSCLLGNQVCYDGSDKLSAFITEELGKLFEFADFCPEIATGMGVPRESIKLVDKGKHVHAVGTQSDGLDVTKPLKQLAKENQAYFKSLAGFILKRDSPSCGIENVPVSMGEETKPIGTGLFARGLMKQFPNLPIEDEERLEDPQICDCFVSRVSVLHRWNQMLGDKPTPKQLRAFHALHKFIIRSHRKDAYKKLRRMSKEADRKNINEICKNYLDLLMITLRVKPTRETAADVLMRLLDKHDDGLDKAQRKVIKQQIEEFRDNEGSADTPLQTLRGLLDCNDEANQSEALFLQPYPAALGLYAKL